MRLHTLASLVGQSFETTRATAADFNGFPDAWLEFLNLYREFLLNFYWAFKDYYQPARISRGPEKYANFSRGNLGNINHGLAVKFPCTST
jgi:hypothetical protein